MRAALIAVVLSSALLGAADYLPARLVSGGVPQPPVNSIGWIEATLDLELNDKGTITRATGLRATPGGLEFLAPYVKAWTFRAATDGNASVPSHVLVSAMIRPPQLLDPAPGQPAADVGRPDEAVPVPIVASRPVYPATAIGDRSVLVEVLVGTDGRVQHAAIVGGKSGFDSSALAAAYGWTFRPARTKGQVLPAAAYLIFGFRAPIGG